MVMLRRHSQECHRALVWVLHESTIVDAVSVAVPRASHRPGLGTIAALAQIGSHVWAHLAERPDLPVPAKHEHLGPRRKDVDVRPILYERGDRNRIPFVRPVDRPHDTLLPHPASSML